MTPPRKPVAQRSVPTTQTYKHWRDVPEGNWRWPDFTPEEIACRGTGKLVVNATAMDRLQELRTALGVPMILNSAYRSPEHNKAVGGEPNSYHLANKKFGDVLTMAFDVSMANHVPADFERIAESYGFRGFGHYPKQNFMHIDTGPSRRWFQGSWFPSKAASQQQPVPRFDAEDKPATITNSIGKPEVVIPIVASAIGTSGIGPALSAGGVFAALAGVALLLVVTAGVLIYLRMQRKPKPND